MEPGPPLTALTLLTRCPGCGEDKQIEWDDVLQCWSCAVCSRQWRRRAGRLVPRIAQPKLFTASMTMDTELD